ncbi:hypothetical protein ACSSS7_007051 [Eimeria intestinalis]
MDGGSSSNSCEMKEMFLDDRHALLFEPSSRSSSASKDLPPHEHTNLSPEIHLFPDSPPPRFLAGPVVPKPASEGLARGPPREAPRPQQRHITLFAAVELPSPRLSASCIPEAASPLPPSSVLTNRNPPVRPASLAVLPDAVPTAAHASAAAPCTPGGRSPHPTQRPIDASGHAGAARLLLPPRQSAAPACPSSLVDKTDASTNSLKSASGGGPQTSGMEDLETRRFVAQELQEEEEAAAHVAAARESLRDHAQHLLNQAAEKLERVAAQQRRRTELAYEEAAAILRRASEARRLLREERNQCMQVQEQRRKDQQLRLMATAQTLEVERRLRLGLQSRLHALQQENTQLRALLHAHCPSRCRGGSASVTSGLPPTSGVSRGHPQPQLACREAAARQTRGRPSGSAPSSGRGACLGSRASEKSSILNAHAARPSMQGTCLTEATKRGAVLDLQLRLPPFQSAAPAAVAAVGLQQQNPHAAAQSSSRDSSARRQQQQQQQEAEPLPPQSPDDIALESHLKPQSARTDRQPEGRRRRGSSAKGCEASGSSLTSNSSLNANLKRRSTLKKKTRRRPPPSSSRLSRSASRGSLSTSTSSSCGRRQLGGLRRSSKVDCSHARSQRISFSVPESHTRRTDTSSDSSPDPAPPLKPPSRLLLRGDVAGRLQASLARLQEKQLLQQEQVRNLAQRALLQPPSQRP